MSSRKLFLQLAVTITVQTIKNNILFFINDLLSDKLN